MDFRHLAESCVKKTEDEIHRETVISANRSWFEKEVEKTKRLAEEYRPIAAAKQEKRQQEILVLRERWMNEVWWRRQKVTFEQISSQLTVPSPSTVDDTVSPDTTVSHDNTVCGDSDISNTEKSPGSA